MPQIAVTVPSLPGLSKLGPAWLREYAKASVRQGWHPAGPLGVMYAESRLDPTANNDGVAVGLLQWTKEGAPASGLPKAESSLVAISRMSALEQLPLVEKYFRGAAYKEPSDYWLRAIGRTDLVGAPSDRTVYMSLANVGKNYEGSPVYQKASAADRFSHRAYLGNQGLDTNADGTITVGEMRAKFIGLLGHSKGTQTVTVDPLEPFEAGGAAPARLGSVLFLATLAAVGWKVLS